MSVSSFNCEKPFFSIIVPTFNRPEELAHCIQSVIDQEFDSWEIIVVDDGGDRECSEEIIGNFSDARIRYFWKENEERSIARNFGFRMSCGRYVVPLDSDDRILPNHLREFYSAILSNGEEGFFHSAFLIEDKAARSWHEAIYPSQYDVSRALAFRNIFAIGAAVIRRDVAVSFPFPESRYAVHGEDWLFFIRIYSRFGVKFVDRVTFVYQVNSASSVRNIDPNRFKASYDLIVYLIGRENEIRRKFGFIRYRSLLASLFLQVALQFLYIDGVSLSEAKKYLVRAFLSAPWIFMKRPFLAGLKLLLLRGLPW
ncbi:glycosyltransferase family 2 protein [Thioclava sp. F28-4]|uniref:glycosyltransferase family 2 protein n=1 Tax=Thioclava sp. F28-4 TaxID=1915315 RepID=UPI000997D144|nr:glycosyltransferase family 2 protein [Thioclava sp. F28-4]OOY04244.1 hypothetical protein BMI87_11850 [Thioclava sp. F28-4]